MADQVVVMSDGASERLCEGFNVDRRKVITIPHGATIPDGPRSTRPGRPTMLTWGLMGPGKGVERVIEAMGSLRDLPGRPQYMVAGRTHPKVLAADGEAYRDARIEQAQRQRRGGFGVLRHRLPQRRDVDHPRPIVRPGGAALRLHRSGDLRRSGRRHRKRPASRGHRISARRRAPRHWSGHRRRPRRPRRIGGSAAPGADATVPRRFDGGRGPPLGSGRWRGRSLQARI